MEKHAGGMPTYFNDLTMYVTHKQTHTQLVSLVTLSFRQRDKHQTSNQMSPPCRAPIPTELWISWKASSQHLIGPNRDYNGGRRGGGVAFDKHKLLLIDLAANHLKSISTIMPCHVEIYNLNKLFPRCLHFHSYRDSQKATSCEELLMDLSFKSTIVFIDKFDYPIAALHVKFSVTFGLIIYRKINILRIIL